MKYIELKISKRAGFWRYKVEIVLNLQPQPQASHIESIIIRGEGYHIITKTGVKRNHNIGITALEIADSKLYHCEDPSDNNFDYVYDLCNSTYLTKPYRQKVKFFLGYSVNINEVIDAFRSLDDEIDKMVQKVPNAPAFSYSQTKTKYIKFGISKKAGYWRYRVKVELNLQPQLQASYIKEISIMGCYGIAKTGIDEGKVLLILGIIDSHLYLYEDPSDSSYRSICNLCPSKYLTRLYRREDEFYLRYDTNINDVIGALESLDNVIDRMMQAPGTPAFNYTQTKTKYIKLEISKKAGFWKYKVEVELNLQPQPQAPYIKKISIGGMSCYGVTETGIDKGDDWITLGIADSELYSYKDDPEDNIYVSLYYLCPPMHLIKSYQHKIKFYLVYDVDINKVINTFENLDNEIDKMVQAPGTPAFNYFLNETKYVKLKISKKEGFWRYRVEAVINLQPQSQAPYIKGIYIQGFYLKNKTEIEEEQNNIFINITESEIFEYENPGKCSYSLKSCLCDVGYLIKLYQNEVIFYLEHNVDINKVIESFRKLDDIIDRMVQAPGTPAFNYTQTETKYIKLEISKKAGFWRYRVKVKLCLQQKILTKDVYIRMYSSVGITGVDIGSDYLQLVIRDSKLYTEENLDSVKCIYYICLYYRGSTMQTLETEFFLEYNCDINAVIKGFETLDNEIDKLI